MLLAVAAFAATNVDNLFVLLAFFAEARDAWRPVVVGQYLGSMALVVLAYVIAALMIHIPREYVGLIGVMPILIGIGKLLELLRRANGSSGSPAEASAGAPAEGSANEADALRETNASRRVDARSASSAWTVATVAIANGSDNLSVYVPLFTTHSHAEDAATAVIFVAMIGLWCVLAKWLVTHRLLGGPIKRYAHWILPWVLMLIGASVIAGNGTLRMIGL